MRLVLTVIFTLCLAFSVSADVNVGLSADKDGLKSFHLALSEHFQVDYKNIDKSRHELKNDEELPVVYHIAERARVNPRVVVALRRQGKSWQQITSELGFTAGIYYVELENASPPFGKALGHFKKAKKNHWHKIRLSDREIIDLVNLRFVSQYNGLKPENVAKMRATGNTFIAINKHIKENKKAEQVATAKEEHKKDKKKNKRGKKN